ncbi:PilX N-terminal domain-containing pilus assembly protein [Pseudomonadota bacterium]
MEMYEVKEVRSSEKGVALIVALFILLILTAIGLSAGDISMFEQRMAGNQLDQDTAFQASESGLRAGEAYLQSLLGVDYGVDGCDATTSAAIAVGGCVSTLNSVNGGVFANSATLPWGGANTFEVGGFPTSGAGEVFNPPEFIVEYVDNVPDAGGSKRMGGGDIVMGSDFYRVTAQGTGRTATSQAIVQSVYARRFSDRRLKMDIKRIGTHPLGIGWYSFEYLWGERAVGVMADEVKKIMPEAVNRHSSGYDMVNYALIGGL